MASQEITKSDDGRSEKSSRSFGLSRSGRFNSQRKSLFSKARMSFVRSAGQRGATIPNLRGTTGADFEAKGDIERGNGASVGGCGCFGGGGGTDSNVIILIKGPFCFVFKSENAGSPKYAISLVNLKARLEENSSGKSPVWLETALGDVEYEVVFDDNDTANRFVTAVTQQAAAGQADMVRKRLGHEHLLNKRASVRFAESVATKKVEDQPEAPVSAEEIMSNVPVPAM